MRSENTEYQKKKGPFSFVFGVILLGLILIGLLLASLAYVKHLMNSGEVEVEVSEQGCLEAEGYIWCELKNSCIHAETEQCIVMEEVYNSLKSLYAKFSDSEYSPTKTEFVWQTGEDSKLIPTPLRGLQVTIDTLENSGVEALKSVFLEAGFEESDSNLSLGQNVQFYGFKQIGTDQVCLMKILPRGYNPLASEEVNEERMMIISCGLISSQAPRQETTENVFETPSSDTQFDQPNPQGSDE